MPEPEGELCSVEEVRLLMQKASGRHEQDALIEKLIKAASVSVMQWCERQFIPAEETTHTFEWPWEGELLSFAPWDLQHLKHEPEYLAAQTTWRSNPTEANRLAMEEAEKPLRNSVLVDTDQVAGPYPCTVQEWRLWPAIKRNGVYQGIRLRPFGAVVGAQIWRERRVEITGTWGFPEVPADVKEATAFTVVHWLSTNLAVFRRPEEDADPTNPRRGIPTEARQLLEHYKRHQFGP